MTMPSSGTISMGQINNELGRSTSATIGLDAAENGAYGALAPYSPTIPSSSNPAYMGKWYGYNGAAFPYYMRVYLSTQNGCVGTARLWQIGTNTGGWAYVADCSGPACNSYSLCGAIYSIPGGYTKQFALTRASGSYIRWGGTLFNANGCGGNADPNSACGLSNPLGIGGISGNWDLGFVLAGCGVNYC